ncbi:NADP-dependent oxidoreductase [Verrucomicrobiaceae bacterium 227]
MQSKQIQLKKRPEGMPSKEDFQIAEEDIGEIKDGEFTVKNEWLSVDPYMRGRMKDSESYVAPFALGKAMEGGCVGQVTESQNDDFPKGTWVLGNSGWRDLWISNGEGVVAIDPDQAPASAYLGVLGLTGMTAYVGLTEIASMKNGDTVFVSAASGAVGSIAAQIAKLHGCKVVGSAGSAEKIAWLKEKAGIDAAFNYHEVDDVSAKLKELCPDGIDVYFDNVGGDHLQGAIDNMSNGGRIASCGMISGYNDAEPKPGPNNLFKIIGKRIMMRGFIVRDHMDLQDEFLAEMIPWIKEGKIHWEETITEGLENAPEAFIGLFEGDKLGKALVKV